MAELAHTKTPIDPQSHRQAQALAILVQLGLALICLSAIYTPQPSTFSLRQWAALLIIALVALIASVRGGARLASTTNGKLLAAFVLGSVFSLAYAPQLADLPGLGEKLPGWLVDLSPGLGTVGLLILVLAGVWYLVSTPRQPRPALRSIWLTALLLAVLVVGCYLVFRQIYDMDGQYVTQLLAYLLEYAALVSLALSLSGRIGVGWSFLTLPGMTLILAFLRNYLWHA